MVDTVRVFDFQVNMHGARVVSKGNPLCPRCLTDGEIDANIKLLKEDLDAVARRMKKAAARQRKKPFFRVVMNEDIAKD